ncbi:sugar ABC transporter substrate-binding protein [Paenibacillus polymyxa]|nr:sugar ABC transporter substrate-binding protein [Paenibacillus polymyxa]
MRTKWSIKSKLLTRRLAVLSISALMISTLAACGGSSNPPTAKEAGKYEVTPGDPFSAYKDEITVTMGRVTTANPKLPAGDSYENNAYTRLVKKRLTLRLKTNLKPTEKITAVRFLSPSPLENCLT